MDDEIWEMLDKEIERADDRHARMEAVFTKLLADTPRMPSVGQRVIIASGLLGRGYLWIREEAEVIEAGQASVLVRFKRNRFDGTVDEQWIHPALVVDILR